jgi:GT2 family glycosyltransferase
MTRPEPLLRISVILVCYNSRDWLPKCLESLRNQTCFSDIEVVIVDNASCDNSQELARTLTEGWTNVQILQTGRNAGFAAANNEGARLARGKYLYFLNPDTWLEPDCLEQLYSAAGRSGVIGGCATVLEYDDQSVQAKGSHGFDVFGNPVSPRNMRAPEPLFCIAGFYFIRRDCFFELGMMDESLFMYGEEMDLSWRVWLSGRSITFVAPARVHHRGAVAVNPAGGTKAVENRTTTAKRFLANRNFLVVIAKNCQHMLLLMLIPCTAMILGEGVMLLLLTRSWRALKTSCIDALIGFWRMRGHILEQRRRIRQLRHHGDFWMLRFLRLGFGRSHELAAILQKGFPKIGR